MNKLRNPKGANSLSCRLLRAALILMALFVMSVSSLGQSQAPLFTPEETAWLKAHPVLTIGVDPDFLPLEGIDAHGNFQGIAAEYIAAMEKIMGVRMIPAEDRTWSLVLEGARDGSIDIVDCLGKTEDRQKYLDFTEPYIRFPAVIITRNDQREYTDMDSLVGADVTVVENYWIHDILRFVHPDLTLKTYPTGRQCLESVAVGETDAFVSDLASASYLIKQLGLTNLRIAGYSPYDMPLHMGVRKGLPELVPILNKAIAAIPESEKKAIYSRWITIEQRSIFETREFWYILSALLFIVLAVIFAIAAWNRTLKRQVRFKTEQLNQELTERRIAEDKFHKVFQNAADAIGLVRLRDGCFLEVNNAFFKILGHAPEEVIGHTSMEFRLYETLEERDRIYRLLNSGRPLENYEANWLTRNGEVRSGLLSTELIEVEGDSCITFVWHDITERKASELALRHAFDSLEQKVLERTAELAVEKEKAESASKAKSIFLANVSHELRTPLNAILGYSRLLMRDKSLGCKQAQDLAVINRSGEHLLALINEVLEISRIEAGKAIVSPSTFNLQGLLGDLETMFRIRAEEKALTLTFRCQDSIPTNLISDENKLRQILINLIGNAVKFTDSGAVEVTVSVEPRGAADMRLLVTVSDTGPGIAEQDLPYLFLPFHQSDTGIRTGSGSGLGLAISRDFARLMNGDITATSALGKGSRFILEIPIQESFSSPKRAAAEVRKVIGCAPGQPLYRALVADDVPENRLLLVRLLDIVGIETREAADGREALRIWQEWHPDVILMDLRMPDIDGYDAMRVIRDSGAVPAAKIIVVTASAFDGDRKRVIETTGALGFVRKPVVEEEFFTTLAECLNLQYEYEEPQEPSSPAAIDTSVFNTDELPDDARTQLLAAASQADIEQIAAQLQTIEARYPSHAAVLRQLLEEFRYDLMIRLLDRRR